MRRKLSAGAIALLMAGLAAGCGGGGDGDGDGPAKTPAAPRTPLTKAEFVKRADKICSDTVAELTRAGASLRAKAATTGKLPPADQIANFLTTTSLPAYERMLGKLRELVPPERDKRTVVAYTGSLEAAINLVKGAPLRYARNPTNDPFQLPNDRAKKYGLDACGA